MDLNSLSHKIHALVKQLDEQNSELLENWRGSRGFPPRLALAELLTFMTYFHYCRFTDFKAFCHHMRQHYSSVFPQLLHYKTLCAWRTRLIKICQAILRLMTQKAANTEEKFIDSTHLDICHPIRADRNRIALYAARKGKNRMGWHCGFKLHLAINRFCEIIGYEISAGNVDDRKFVEDICEGKNGSIYADRGYLSAALSTSLAKKSLRLVTRNRCNMPRKELSSHDRKFLKKRGIIETVIGVLKSRNHIDHTRHRSFKGFTVNVLMGLIAYALHPNKPSLQ